MNNLVTIFEGNWDTIKGKIKKQWGKFKEDDIEQIEGSYAELVGKLKKIYGYEMDKIEEEIREFLAKYDFEEAQNQANKMKEMLVTSLAACVQKLKDKSFDAEKKVVNYVREKPLESVGVLAIAGLTVSCLLKLRK